MMTCRPKKGTSPPMYNPIKHITCVYVSAQRVVLIKLLLTQALLCLLQTSPCSQTATSCFTRSTFFP
jgi:hypothetical protein